MKYRRSLLLALLSGLILSYGCLFGSGSDDSGNAGNLVIFGVNGISETPVAMRYLPDGSLVLAGWAIDTKKSITTGFLYRLRADGGVIWHVTPEGIPHGMDITADGKLVLGGETADSKAWIAKYDLDGNKIWAKTTLEDFKSARINAVVGSMDGRLVFGGWHSTPGAPGMNMAVVISTDADGNLCTDSEKCWKYEYDMAGYQADWDEVTAMLEVQDPQGKGNRAVLIAGRSGSITQYKAWMALLANDGQVIWRKDLPSEGDQHTTEIKGLAETDNGYVGVGSDAYEKGDTTVSKGWVVVVNKLSGDVAGHVALGNGDEVDLFEDVIGTKTGFLAIGSSMRMQPPTGWLVEFGWSNGLLKSRPERQSFVGGSGYITQLFCGVALPDGGFIVAGTAPEDASNILGPGDILLAHVGPQAN